MTVHTHTHTHIHTHIHTHTRIKSFRMKSRTNIHKPASSFEARLATQHNTTQSNLEIGLRADGVKARNKRRKDFEGTTKRKLY